MVIGMFDRSTWEFINTFAPWLSAIGTILLAWLTFYLYRRDKKIKLKVNTDLGLDYENGEEKETINIYVINVGYRTTYLKDIVFKAKFFNRKSSFRIESYLNISDYLNKLKIELKPQDATSINFDKNKFINEVTNELHKILPKGFIKLGVYLSKIGVKTSSKKIYKERVSKDVRKLLIKGLIKKYEEGENE